MDNIKTFEVACMGGLITNLDVLQHGKLAPGSALQLVNMEPHDGGGYRRILGCTKFDATTVPGTGNILGVGIIANKAVACRGTDVYSGSGTGWTKINGVDTRTGAVVYRSIRYNFTGTEVITFCDGVNKPFKYDGTTYTVLSSAPTGTQFIATFKNHFFCGAGTQLTFAAPATDNDFNPANGAGLINVADTIKGLKVFRDQLIVFCENRILRVTGTNSTDFTLIPITENIGCVAPDSIQELGGDVLFLAPDGLRTVSATDRIGDFELGVVSRNVKPTLEALKDGYTRLVSCVVRSKSQYRLFGYKTGINSDNLGGVLGSYVQRNDATGFEFAQLRGFKVYVADSQYNSSGDEVILFGNDSGYVYQFEVGNSIDGGNIISVYQTPYYAMDDANTRKVFYKLHGYMSFSGAYDLNVQLYLDYKNRGTIQPSSDNVTNSVGDGIVYGASTSLYGTATYGSTLMSTVVVPLVGAGMSGSLQFFSNGTNPPFAIKSLSIEYGLGGRR